MNSSSLLCADLLTVIDEYKYLTLFLGAGGFPYVQQSSPILSYYTTSHRVGGGAEVRYCVDGLEVWWPPFHLFTCTDNYPSLPGLAGLDGGDPLMTETHSQPPIPPLMTFVLSPLRDSQ